MHTQFGNYLLKYSPTRVKALNHLPLLLFFLTFEHFFKSVQKRITHSHHHPPARLVTVK